MHRLCWGVAAVAMSPSVFSSAVPSGSEAFQMPTRPSSSAAASTLRGGGGGGGVGGGGKGQSQKRFSNFFSFLA